VIVLTSQINKISQMFAIILEMECVTLPQSDGLKISCDSAYTTGLGYEGDTCSFTCNPGYEFSGSHTRTCQSDGSWSGVEAVCKMGLYFVFVTVSGVLTN